LPNLRTTPDALKAMHSEKAIKLFEKYKVLSNIELKSRYNVRLEKYTTDIDIEAKALYNIVLSQVIPSAVKYQKEISTSIDRTVKVLKGEIDISPQKDILNKVSQLINKTYKLLIELKKNYEKGSLIEDHLEMASFYCNNVKKTMDEIRENVDQLEIYIDDELWPMPKFWEMLFII